MSLTPTPRGRPLSAFALAAIVGGNLAPILGVLFLGWDAGQILILYWIENFAVGLFTLPRILMAQGPAPGSVIGGTPLGARVATALFFTVHYGLFWAAHGVFAFLVASGFPRQTTYTETDALSFGLAALIVFGAQGWLFARQWLQAGVWRTATPTGEMFRPYGRLVVLHLTVLLGAFGLSQLGAPAWTMTLLCVGKMLIELGAAIGPRLLPERRVDQST